MDHPLRSDDCKELRGRVVQLLKSGFSILRQSNIVFVCGGNKPEDMRQKFHDNFQTLMPDHEFFKPEFAMKNYFALGDSEPFDIADFESLVADLSMAIVLFPEAPGSYAELGYFSANEPLAKKIVLALDSNYQRNDSFISLGPVNKINELSIFRHAIQLDYKNPDFSLISQRINDRVTLNSNRKRFEVKEFNQTGNFELFSLIHQIVSLLVVATIEDIESILRSIFSGRISPSTTKKIVSILVGSKRLVQVGDFSHFTSREDGAPALFLQDGHKTDLRELNLEISAELSADSDFDAILRELRSC